MWLPALGGRIELEPDEAVKPSRAYMRSVKLPPKALTPSGWGQNSVDRKTLNDFI